MPNKASDWHSLRFIFEIDHSSSEPVILLRDRKMMEADLILWLTVSNAKLGANDSDSNLLNVMTSFSNMKPCSCFDLWERLATYSVRGEPIWLRMTRLKLVEIYFYTFKSASSAIACKPRNSRMMLSSWSLPIWSISFTLRIFDGDSESTEIKSR